MSAGAKRTSRLLNGSTAGTTLRKLFCSLRTICPVSVWAAGRCDDVPEATLRSAHRATATTAMARMFLGCRMTRMFNYRRVSRCNQAHWSGATLGAPIMGRSIAPIPDGESRNLLLRMTLYNLELRRARFRDGVVLLARSATYADRADDFAVFLQRNSTGKDHDPAVV